MGDPNEKDKLELEFLMEGVTTRMQTAMEKLAESNRTQSAVSLAIIIIVVAGFIINNKMMIDHVNSIRGSAASEAVNHETIPQLGPGQGD